MYPEPKNLTLLYLIGELLLTIVFLVVFFKRRDRLKPYFFYGYLVAFTVLFLRILIILSVIKSTPSPFFSGGFSDIIVLSLEFLLLIVFTTVGMRYATQLKYQSFPTIVRIQSGAKKIKNIIPNRSFLLIPLAFTAFSALYSIILFKFGNPELGELGKISAENLRQVQFPHLTAYLLFLVAAFVEEIFFRLCLQNFLAKRLNLQHNFYWVAIIITSIFWTVAHAGIVDPDWVKFAQTLPMGLFLGWLFRKHGVESCILAHGLFNTIGVLVVSIFTNIS